MRVRLLVNPVASGVGRRTVEDVRRAMSAHHDVQQRVTSERGHAVELAADAVRDGADAVVVLGGDGTLNEAACSLAGTDVPLGALPGGSTSIVVRTIGGSLDPCRAAVEVSDALDRGSVRRVGVGTADGRPFLAHAGVGWDASLVAVVERHATWKRRLGHGMFLLAGLQTVAGGYDRSTPHLDAALSGAEGPAEVEGAYFLLALNSDPYTYVGPRPFSIEPGWSLASDERDARPGLVVLALRSMSLRRFVPLVPAALSGRGLTPRPWLDVHRGVRSAHLTRRTSMPYQLDGDHLGDPDSLDLGWRPDALGLIVPVSPPR